MSPPRLDSQQLGHGGGVPSRFPLLRADPWRWVLGLRRHRVGGEPARWLTPIALGIGAWILRDALFGWRAADLGVYLPSASGMLGRAGVALAGWCALAAYDAVIRPATRGPDDLHPVRARQWVAAQLRNLLRERLPLLAAALVVLVPCARDGRLLAGGAVLLVAAWLAGLLVGAGAALAAPATARDPRQTALLDALRGANPREQAALLWAPAAAMGIAGVAVVFAAGGLAEALAGGRIGWLGLTAPALAAFAGWRWSQRSERELARVGPLLAEIDAAWASADAPDETRAAYLDGIARIFPPPTARELLRVLRHGWRARRPALSASWLGALVAAAAGWQAQPSAMRPVILVAGSVAAAIGLIAPALRASDPAWLDRSLPARPVVVAHALATLLWAQPVVLSATAAAAVRVGVAALGTGARIELLVGLLALASGRLRTALYLPVALLLCALAGWA